MSSMRFPFVLCSLALAALTAALSGCDSHAADVNTGTNAAAASAGKNAVVKVAAQPQSRAEVFAHVKQMTVLGEKLFFDPSLSGSGKLACASCHSPQHAFGPPNALSVQLGGSDMHQTGIRAVPSLRYLQSVPAFTRHFHDSDDEGDESVDAGPTGGLTWDGRVDHGADQARIPLLSSFEMGSTPAKVAAAVKASPYADTFRQAYGADVFQNDERVFAAVLVALETFEQSPERFYPYTSKYDAFLAGRAKLNDAEMRGLQLFNDESKGNCAACHISTRAKDGSPPQFSDFGLIALGVPRNRALPVNRNPKYHDLGACGPERTDLKEQDEYCGIFRTPSLRNVATRKTFFHNGIYHKLDDVVRFYVERDTNPEKFYPVSKTGAVQKFDDLPKKYWDNINTEPPFDRKKGDKPALDEAEIKDVVAFLGTLTDGYDPAKDQDAQKGTGIGEMKSVSN
ncbi:cytochrome c peroxidase [Caballeronia sp. LZ065]|uniref:cytochrome-c peroxidase n=1 Tax=Caballeronia sp. LZ065 TaxID=3038571 RepID=UPI002858FF55|nr:cytochrome c peroxidase [Caballeronia sp. LZ065]MDR5779898.1 cytochrome c peroxidase [Caballeronia sp. LZ065]